MDTILLLLECMAVNPPTGFPGFERQTASHLAGPHGSIIPVLSTARNHAVAITFYERDSTEVDVFRR